MRKKGKGRCFIEWGMKRERTWGNGIEEGESEIGMVMELGGSVMRVEWEVSVTEVVKIFCSSCSFGEWFFSFFLFIWLLLVVVAHLARSLTQLTHSISRANGWVVDFGKKKEENDDEDANGPLVPTGSLRVSLCIYPKRITEQFHNLIKKIW